MAFAVSMQPEKITQASIAAAHTGVILLGGAHGALALARSFGRNGIPVVLVTDDHPLPKFSRYIQRRFDWPGANAAESPRWLVQLAERENLRDWLLVPCGDGEVRLIASQLQLMRSTFRVESCDWEHLRRLCDKQLLAQSAAAAGIAAPRAYRLRSEADAATLEMVFPVVLKPAMRTVRNAFTQAKAWRAGTREELIDRYREAAKLVGHENVVVQELIPGGGEAQFSYAALWHQGKPVAELTARRTRQYPIDFSYTSTFVEIVTNDKVKAAANALLTAIAFEGLVEVEFKYDARDQEFKILDVNPRAWSWLALCEPAGADLALMMSCVAAGLAVKTAAVLPGHAWMHTARDLIAAAHLMVRGHISFADYLRSLRQKLTFAAFAWDDPLPGIIEMPLTVYRVVTRAIVSLWRRGEPTKATTSRIV
jgi:predicted ATP-grasp superfamily ATP-dependent carboligase